MSANRRLVDSSTICLPCKSVAGAVAPCINIGAAGAGIHNRRIKSELTVLTHYSVVCTIAVGNRCIDSKRLVHNDSCC